MRILVLLRPTCIAFFYTVYISACFTVFILALVLVYRFQPEFVHSLFSKHMGVALYTVTILYCTFELMLVVSGLLAFTRRQPTAL